MKHVTFKLLLSLLLLASSTEAQEPCAHSFMQQKSFETAPDYLQKVEANNEQLRKIIAQQKSMRSAEETFYIPIVVHVVHLGEPVGTGSNISDAQVKSGIDQLNAGFSNAAGGGVDVKVQFRLAKLDPNCTPTDGIVRVNGSGVSGYSSAGVSVGGSGADEVSIKDLSRWPINDYYNIWLVTEFNNNNGGNGTQGFAYFPESVSPTRDGAMIMHTAWGDQGTANSWNNKGTTGIHEIGHALNLYHTFEGDEDGGGNPQCPPDGCGSDLGDCCDDTSPHIRSNSDCPTSDINTCTGQLNDDVIMNYMDYSSQDCGVKFTQDQKVRMRAALTNFRSGLLSSKGLDSTQTSFAAVTNAVCAPQTGSTGLSANWAGILQVQFGSINNSSGYAAQDGGYVDYTGSCLASTEVALNAAYTLSVSVGVNSNRVKAWIDWNSDGVFSNSEQVMDQTIASKTTGSTTVSVPGNATLNTALRMRILNDLSTVTSSCYNPTHGQAEDYPVIVRTSLGIVPNETSITTFPNPTLDVVNITGGSTFKGFRLIDQSGKSVLEGRVNTAGGTLSLSALSAGYYFLIIEDQSSPIKLVKL